MNKNQMSRRQFLHTSAATTGVAMAMPRIMLGDSRIPYGWEAAASDTAESGELSAAAEPATDAGEAESQETSD